jgi:thymidine kinase
MVCHSAAIDQVQFLDPSHIDQLRHIVSVWKIPVIAYGLRTDFRTNFFPGSSRLMELADNIEEVNSTFTCVGSSSFERFDFYEVV